MANIIYTDEVRHDDDLGPALGEWVYNGLDCAITLEVFHNLKKILDAPGNEDAAAIYRRSRALQAPVLEITLRGLRVNHAAHRATLAETKQQIARVAKQLERIIKDGVGIDLNWRSPADLKYLFYSVLRLKEIRKRNAKGGFSATVNREALERLRIHFYAEPIVNHLLLLRDLDKRRQFLETKLDPDGRMRASWNIAGTKTGRLSSATSDFGTGTNNQNVNDKMRRMFIADPGMKLCNIDLEQADSRNVGAICWNLFLESHGPEFAGAYLDACESGDLHTFVCTLGWPHLPWTDDPKENRKIADQKAYRDFSYRDLAKRLGHGTNYDGLQSLIQTLKLSRKSVMEFQERYFSGFQALKLWHEWVKSRLRNEGYITTPLRRRRYFFGRSTDPNVIRQAIAYGPQSMTGDELNIGWLRLWKTGTVQFLGQVHDSVLFQYPEDMEDEIVPMAIKALTFEMELKGGRKFSVPVEAAIGWNWGKTGKDGDNPYGLVTWKGPGHDQRRRPKNLDKKATINLEALWVDGKKGA